MLTQEKIVWLFVGFFIGIIVAVGGMTVAKQTQPAAIVINPPEPTPAPKATATAGPIRVYVNGQVLSPDVYELSPNSIVEDAILSAGGFTAAANKNVVNLAQSLNNGAQVYVPSEDEEVAVVAVVNNTAVSDNENKQLNSNTPLSENSGGLININTATIEQLESLSGIGPSTAQKIVDHREENGLFVVIEDIMDVSGIGEAKFGQMEPFITVEGE